MDQIPRQVMQITPYIDEQPQILICHVQAIYLLRKALFELAHRSLPDLQRLELTSAMVNTSTRQKQIEDRFEAMLINKHGFSTERQYSAKTFPQSCTNVQILYKCHLNQR